MSRSACSAAMVASAPADVPQPTSQQLAEPLAKRQASSDAGNASPPFDSSLLRKSRPAFLSWRTSLGYLSNSSCTSPPAFSAGRPPVLAVLPRASMAREGDPAPARSPKPSTQTLIGSVCNPSVRRCPCAAEPLTRAPLPSTGICAQRAYWALFLAAGLTLSKRAAKSHARPSLTQRQEP